MCSTVPAAAAGLGCACSTAANPASDATATATHVDFAMLMGVLQRVRWLFYTLGPTNEFHDALSDSRPILQSPREAISCDRSIIQRTRASAGGDRCGCRRNQRRDQRRDQRRGPAESAVSGPPPRLQRRGEFHGSSFPEGGLKDISYAAEVTGHPQYRYQTWRRPVLHHPGVAFRPDGSMLVTERPGRPPDHPVNGRPRSAADRRGSGCRKALWKYPA